MTGSRRSASGLGPEPRALRRWLSPPGIGLALLIGIAALTILAPALAPNPPERQYAGFAYAPPMIPRIVHEGSLRAPFVYPLVLQNRLDRTFVADTHAPQRLRFFTDGRLVASPVATPWLLLGADPLGRDVFSRLLTGARLSLLVATAAVLLTLLVGATFGATAAFAGGLVDRAVTGAADLIVVLPLLYAVLTLRSVMPLVLDTATIFWTMVVVMAVATWPLPARGVRAIVALESRKPYAEAAYALGSSPLRILLRHVLPSTTGHLATQALLLFPAFVFAEATLSFIGLGFAEPQASWGVMLQDAGRVQAMLEAPWLLAPAAAIVITVLAVHLITRRES
jgi:peptide/nickel transport system permease protein